MVEISIDEIDENTPSPLSSAGADLAKDLRGIVGNEYSNKYTNRSKIMDGHTYRLYETMEFSISKCNTLSWKSGTTIASILAGIISVAPIPANVATFCGIMSIVGSVASTAERMYSPRLEILIMMPISQKNTSTMAYLTKHITHTTIFFNINEQKK